MHSKRSILAAALWSAFPLVGACASTPQQGGSQVAPGGEEQRPNLVVYLVVDQLRGDLLDRYADAFTGGLKRLLENGLVFTNALHEHAATETSPGHAALSTGVNPARAGIPSNAWREGEGSSLHPVYNVVDPTESLVGIPDVPGASPRVLRRTGLADWIRERDSDSKIVSISAKDRAAVLMAGQSKGDVYWFDSGSGRFVTSSFYGVFYPSWLIRFNKEGMRGFRSDSIWASTVPDEFRGLSAPDTATFEGDGVHSFFPHRYRAEGGGSGGDDFFIWFETTPMLDRATLEVSLLAILEEELGQGVNRTDFLSISFSQTDRVGHAYGPLSREQMDNLLRLDQVLGELFSFLDQVVGRDNYVVGFTSDHGVMNMPERMSPQGTRLSSTKKSELEYTISRAAREANTRGDSTPAGAMLEAIKTLPYVGPAFTQDELSSGEPADSFAVLFEHSFTPGRAGGLLSIYGIEMWWAENVLSWGLPVGTTHGSPFYYDRWVPLIVMGPGIEGGRVAEPVRPLDLAPTLAQLAGVRFPGDLDGRPLKLNRN